MTLRPGFMVAALLSAHLLDALTFWVALSLYRVPISAEQNALMRGAYTAGGFGLVLVTELTIVAIGVSLLARVTTKPIWPAFLVFYALGLFGTAGNLVSIHSFGGI